MSDDAIVQQLLPRPPWRLHADFVRGQLIVRADRRQYKLSSGTRHRLARACRRHRRSVLCAAPTAR
jgi:hypothetical protein